MDKSVFELLLYSVAIFVSTNLDDIFILLLFFSDKQYKVRDILVGQLLGIASLIALSMAGGLIGLIIPSYYLGILGVFPIYLGVNALIKLRVASSEENDPAPSMHKSYAYQFLFITTITIANGGDNVGIYVPIFSNLPWLPMLIMIFVFTIMTLLWCLLALYLTSHPKLAEPIKRLSVWVTPFLLIGLGVYILFHSQIFKIFRNI